MLARYIDKELKIVNSNNFNLKKYYGFKDFEEDVVPTYDKNFEKIVKEVIESDDTIRLTYIVKPLEGLSDGMTVDNRIAMLENNDIVHEIALAELYELGSNNII